MDSDNLDNLAQVSSPAFVNAQYLTPEQLSARWCGSITVTTLRTWRSRGRGPIWSRLGSRILYRIRDVEAYEDRVRLGKQPSRRDDP